LPQEQVVTAVVLTSDGGAVVAGSFRGELTLGAQTLQSMAQRDGFVAKLSAAGAPVWLTQIGANGNEDVQALALRDDGGIYVGGTYDGEGPSISALPPKTGQVDAFLLVLDANGMATGRENHFGDSGGRAFVRALHATDAGVTVAGAFTRSIIFEQRHVSGVNGNEPADPQPTHDAFVVRLDEGLEPLWSRRFGAHGDDAATSVVVDANDDVIISGYFEASVPFILGTHSDSNGDSDGFVTKLAGASGDPLWVHTIGRNEPDAVTGMVVDQEDRVTIVGTFQSGFTLAGEAVSGRAEQDVCVIAFAP
jgi:hypothetical protein